MAHDITMKRYDATLNNGNGDWVDLYPKTKAGNLYTADGTTKIFDSNDKLQSTYIDLATTVTGTGDGASKPVTSGAVASAIQTATEDLTEIAEGKTKTFVTDLVPNNTSNPTGYYILAESSSTVKSVGTNIQYSTAGIHPYEVTSSTTTLDLNEYIAWYCVEAAAQAGYYKITYVINNDGSWTGTNDTSGNIHVGDNLLITDVAFPDFWFTTTAGYSLSILETAKIDLSDYQLKVPKLGSTTKPVYTSADGTFAECSTYAGGTVVNLNGSLKGGDTAAFYAPTGSGTANQILISAGANSSPTWTSTTDTYTTLGNGIFGQAGAYSLWSNTVHTTGNVSQTITGTKTFSAAPQLNLGASFKAGSTNNYITVTGQTTSGNVQISLPTSTGTLALQSELNTTYLSLESSAPSNPITGDLWFAYTA